jgi:hypothetical protein
MAIYYEEQKLTSTVRVKLASGIASRDINLSSHQRTRDLNVVRGLNEMHAGEGAIAEQALATARMTVEGIRKQNGREEL